MIEPAGVNFLFVVMLMFDRISKYSLNIQTHLISLMYGIMNVSRYLCVTDKIDFIYQVPCLMIKIICRIKATCVND